MELDMNTAVLSSRVYAALRERFFVGNFPGDKADADGGEVIATIRKAILTYVDETIRAS